MKLEELRERIKKARADLDEAVENDRIPKADAETILAIFDMADTGICLTERVVKDYAHFDWVKCPTEIIAYLEDRLDEIQEHM